MAHHPMDADPQPVTSPRLPLLAAVFLTALSVLAFEVALSRAFSVLLRFHFVFLAISLATSGLGLGGLADYLTGRWLHRTLSLGAHLSLRAAALAVLYPLSVYLLFATPLAAHLTSVWVVSGICILPFFVAGTLLSRVFAEYSQAGGTLYFADLFGAALGSFLVIGALQCFGATQVPFLCGLVAALAALALSGGVRHAPTRGVAVAVPVLLAGLLVANMSLKLVDLPIMPLRDDPAAKPLYRELGDPQIGAKIVYSEWNAFARTDVVTNARPDGTTDPHDDLYIYTDGEVPTNMLWFPGKLADLGPRLESFIGFRPFDWFRPGKVLLIGPGGGLDVLLASAAGARQIVGAEINPSIPRIVRRYGDFNGHIYDRENVRLYVDEGRSFVRRSREQYDLIYLALTKTATTASNSLALVEGYIYTEEAFEDYLQHLTPDGKVAMVLQEPALLLRTMLTALDALQHQGLSREQALDSLMVASVPEGMYGLGPYRHLLIVSRQPFAPQVSASLAKETVAMGFSPGYFPGAFEPAPFSWLTQQGATTPQFVTAWNQWQFGKQLLNILPRTDDQPFVVDMTFRLPTQFLGLLGGALLLAIVFSVAAMARQRRERGLATAVAYFALLGAGFMLVEIALIQKLVLYLGYPVLSLSVILFALLLGGGLGSLISQRWGVARASRVAGLATIAVVAYGVLLQHGQGPIVAATLGWDIRLRCLVTMLLLLPLGAALGMPFPTGLRAVGSHSPGFVPWMWGVNGLMSVVGSVGAMMIAKFWGFQTTLWCGWAVYALASLLAWSGRPLGTRGHE
ncbi:hypothetical protein LLH23_18920 [bacterium]|nr:hypothetical protein [bacterium]